MGKLLARLFLSALALLFSSHAASQSISVLPNTMFANVGQQFDVAVFAMGLTSAGAPSLGTYDFDLTYDLSLLSYVSGTYGTSLDVLGLGSVQTTTPTPGSINFFEVSLDVVEDLNQLQSGDFRLVTAHFLALATGISPIGISLNAFGDADGLSLSATTFNGSVVIAVPEPRQYALLTAGMLLIGCMVYRRQRLHMRSWLAG